MNFGFRISDFGFLSARPPSGRFTRTTLLLLTFRGCVGRASCAGGLGGNPKSEIRNPKYTVSPL